MGWSPDGNQQGASGSPGERAPFGVDPRVDEPVATTDARANYADENR